LIRTAEHLRSLLLGQVLVVAKDECSALPRCDPVQPVPQFVALFDIGRPFIERVASVHSRERQACSRRRRRSTPYDRFTIVRRR
jgi:hypothetical protein